MALKILVVEDDFANQQVATLFLKRFGYQTEVAVNGQEALELAMDNQYGLIYMDCQMPVLDGFETCLQLRRRDNPNQSTAIVALTANMVSGINQRCLDAGMDDVICKPINMQVLETMTKRWFNQQSGFLTLK
jgi:two-component system, sensor histidine kinase